jgi:peptidoglycan/LPS O-acetylase OafA/YrhL
VKKIPSIPSLDGLRALSIAIVILSHGGGLDNDHSFAYRLAVFHGRVGVRVFFVISGFLITTLLQQEKGTVGSISLRLFYARRALRIVPAFLLYIAGACMLRHFGAIAFPNIDLVYAFTYTVNFFSLTTSWWLGHLWSLSVEEQFYLIWPLVMALFSKRFSIAVATLAIFFGVLIGIFHRLTGIILADGDAFPLVCGSIASGCLAALFYPRIEPYLKSKWVALLCVVGLPLVFVFDTVFTGSWSRWVLIATDIVLTLAIVRSIAVPGDAVGRLLNWRPLMWVGKLSYSLYLWQELFFNPSEPLLPFPLNLLVTVLLAILSYYTVEKPFMGLRHRFSRSSSDRAQLAEAG